MFLSARSLGLVAGASLWMVSAGALSTPSKYIHVGNFGLNAQGTLVGSGIVSELWHLPASLDGTVAAVILRSGVDPVGRQVVRLTNVDDVLVAPEESGSPSADLAYEHCYLLPPIKVFALVDQLKTLTSTVAQVDDCVHGLASTAPFEVVAERGDPVVLETQLPEAAPLIEALPVTISRNGQAWRTYYFGYSLGVVKIVSHHPGLWPNFEPRSLPPPIADGQVVEYRNTADFATAPGGHFFYSADPDEQVLVDSGALGHWQRTGKTFSVGGYLPVCRFYGSVSPGPNSHFFTVDPGECNALKQLQQTPLTSKQQWNFEGKGFYTSYPQRNSVGVTSCPSGTVAVYRAYNNAFAQDGTRSPWDSNHRFSIDHGDISAMVAQGWRDEGTSMCAPQMAN